MSEPRRTARLVPALALLALGACGAPAQTSPRSTPRASAAPATTPAPRATRTGDTFHAFMPRPVTSFGAAVADGRLYVLGGYDGTPHAYTAAGQSGELWSVDLERGEDWQRLPGVEGLQGLALVAHGGRVCRVGGMRAGEDGALRSIDEAACFDPRSGAWSALPALPAPRSSHDAAVIGDTLFVVGGWELDGEAGAGRFHDRMLALDLTQPDATWREIPMPFQRRGLGVAAAGGALYVVGGIEPSRQVSSRVDVYDVAGGAWREAPAYPGDAFGVATVGVGDTVYASARDGVVRALRAGGSEWHDVGRLAFPRFFHRLVARSPDELLALGGIRGMTDAPRTDHVESVSIARAPGAASLVAFEVPYPGRAKNRQGAFLHGDQLHLFGGNVSLEQHDFEPQHFVAEHHVLDLPSLTWARGADYPYPRQTIQTAVLGERGIAIGGFGHAGPGGESGGAAITHPEAFTYAFDEDAWTPRASMPVARSQFGLAEQGGRLWVFGGLDYDPAREGEDAFRHLTEILVADASEPEAPFERAAVEMTSPRRAFGGAVLGDRYYVVGGMRGGFELVTDCQAFDFERSAWSPIACPRRPRLNPQLVAIGERLYLVGGTGAGEGGLAPERSIEVYDPEADRWSVLVEDIGMEPKHLRAFEYRGKLLLVSTHDDAPRAHLALVTPER